MRDTVMELERMCSGDSAISLLVGFPDYSPPENLVEYIKDTVSGKNIILNQYCTTTNGHLPLLEAFADLYSPKFNRTLHPLKNIATSIGATGALMKLFRSFTLPGDEIILFEPYYTLFYHMMQDTSGATAVTVPLHLNRSPNAVPPTSADFTFDPEELEAAFTEKTKMLLCNTPHNPTGKMFTREEMEIVANLCKKHDVICIADEVYEMFTYSDQEHIKMATLPGMWERTVTVGSVGKLFGMTAWATGYVIGPEHLIEKYLQRVVIPMNTVLQDVYAQAYRHELNRLDQPNCFFKALPRELKAKRDQVMHIMSGIGLEPIAPEGGYFIFADVSKFDDQYCQASGDKASNFALWLCKEKGIGVAPASVFYSTANSHLGENYIRICFVKSEATLNIAEDRLKGVKVSRNNDEICNVLANGKDGLANCKDDLVNGKEDLTNSKDG